MSFVIRNIHLRSTNISVSRAWPRLLDQ